MGANVLKATTAIAILIVAAAAFSSLQTSDAEPVNIDGIEYDLKEGGGVRTAMVTAYSVTTMTGDVAIPSQVTHSDKTYAVTGLAKTLRGNAGITSVSLPETVVSIDPYFFNGCTSLKSVTMDGVLSIPLQCFGRCTSLTEVSAVSATSIGANAFDGCSSLSKISIGTPETISDYAFRGCSDLTSFELDEKTVLGTAPFANSGIAEPMICDGLLVYVPSNIGSYTIPSSVYTIGAGAFYNVALDHLDVPGTVLTVSDYGFYCSKISSIAFDPAVAGIGNYAFADVAANSSRLTEVMLPTAITYLGEGVFQNCGSLKTIDIPEEIVMIGTDTFNKCSSLESVGLHGATLFGDTVFSGCSALKSFTFPEGCIPGAGMFRECRSLESVTLCQSIADIPDYMFYKCAKMTSFEIPDQVKTIGKYALSESAVEEIAIPATVDPDGIDKQAFRACASLRKVTFMGPLVTIPEYCFFGCKGLSAMEIRGMVKTENANAFNNTSLKEFIVHTGTPFKDSVMFNNAALKPLIKDDETNGCKYVDVKVPSGSGYADAKVLISSGSTPIKIDGSYAGFVWDALDSALSNGGTISSGTSDIRMIDGSVYRGSELLYVSPSTPPSIENGTLAIRPFATSLTGVDTVSVPASVKTIDTEGISAPQLKHVVMYGSPSTVPGSISSPETKVYFLEGNYHPEVSVGTPLSGYFADTDGGRVLFTINDTEHSTFSESHSGNTIDFEIGLLEGYTDSAVTASADGKPVPGSAGKFSLKDVSKDTEVMVSGVDLNRYDVSCPKENGFKWSISQSKGIIHGDEVLFGIRALPGYRLSESFAAMIDGVKTAPFYSEDDYRVYSFTAIKDVTITVTGVQPNDSFTVTFDARGGSPVTSQRILDGACASIPSEPTRTGFSFIGWYASSDLKDLYEFGPVHGDVTVYAGWADDSAGNYTVSFDADNGSVTAYANGSSTPIASGTKVPAGSTVKVVFSPDEGCEATWWTIDGATEWDCSSERVFIVDKDLSISVSSQYYATGSFINSVGFDTPTAGDYVQSWTFGRGGTTGASFRNMVYAPAVIGGYVYAKNDNVLLKIDADDGRLVKSVETAPSFSGFYEYLAVGNGLILDGITGKVFDADLEQKFILTARSAKTYYNEGRFYVETSNGTSCFAASDENPTDGSNMQRPLWTADTGSFVTPYEGGTAMLFHNGFVMVCGHDDEGSIYLQTSDAATGQRIDRLYIPQFDGHYTNKGYIDISEGYATVTTYTTGLFEFSNGPIDNVASVRIGEDGKFDHATLKVKSNGSSGGFSTALIVSGGLGYVSSGGTFTVYDMETMEPLVSKTNGMLYNHGSMAISTGHPGKVYAYIVPYNNSPDLYVVEHDLKSGSLSINRMENVAANQYSSQQVHFLADGGIVYTNDSGKLFCIRHDAEVQSIVLDGSAKVPVGGTLELEPSFVPGTAGIRTLAWESSDGSIATVEDGKVTGVSEGTAIITATSSNGRIASCTVKVGTTSYVIIWNNWDGTELCRTEVEEGKTPVYPGKEPTRDRTDGYTYTFAGWDRAMAPAASDTTYTATFTPEIRSYEVAWTADGKTLRTDTVEYGETPAYDETPVKEQNARYTYTFVRWDPAITPVNGNMTYVAVFEPHIRSYEITWMSEGETLRTDTVEYGMMPSYDGAPVKEQDAQHTYRFIGWTPSPIQVSDDATYTAVFSPSPRMYTITYLPGEHGLFLPLNLSAAYGSPSPAFNGTLKGEEGYKFAGWTPSVASVVTGDAEYTAQWVFSGHDVTYYVDNVQVGEVESHGYGEVVTIREIFTKIGYDVSEWSTKDADVTGGKFTMPDNDVTFNATSSIKHYSVTWKDWDGTILLTNEADWGSYPSYYGAVPSKASEGGTAYSFSGWKPQLAPACADAEYTATYGTVPLTFEIRWISEDEVLRVDHLDYGSTPYFGDVPDFEKGGIRYKFTGWTPEPAIVTGDATYTAVFEPVISCTIVYQPGDKGSFEPQTYTVENGSATPPFQGTATGAEGYSFAGWSPEVSDTVTEDAEYVAQWALESFIVKYEVDGVQVGDSETHSYGETVAVRDAYVKEGYDVSPWTADGIEPVDGKFVMPAKDVTFAAESSIKTFVIIWKDWNGATLRETVTSYHEIPVYAGEAPQREGYTFVEWSPVPSPCTGDTAYTALYKRTTFTVTWKDWDGTVLSTGTANAGTVPSYLDPDPTRPFDGAYEYKFTGWSPKPAAIYSDREYSAQYSKTPVHIPVNVEGVSLDKTTLSLAPGYAAVLNAIVSPSDADVKDVRWSSEDPRIAAVEADGKVSAVSPGKTTVLATTAEGGFQASCSVTVSGYEYDTGNGTVSEEQASAISSAARATSGSAITIFSRSQSVSIPAGCLRDMAESKCPVTFAMGDGTAITLGPESLRKAGADGGTVTVSAGRSSPELASEVPSGAEIRDISISSGTDVPVTVSIPYSGEPPVEAAVLKDGKIATVPATYSSGKAGITLDEAAAVAVYTHAPEPGTDIKPYFIAGCVIAVLAAIATIIALRRRS